MITFEIVAAQEAYDALREAQTKAKLEQEEALRHEYDDQHVAFLEGRIAGIGAAQGIMKRMLKKMRRGSADPVRSQ
jgi:hypothetical protein